MTDRKILMYRRNPDLLRRDIMCELGIGRMTCADLARRLFDASNDNAEFRTMYAVVWQRLEEMLDLGEVRRNKTPQCVRWELT